MTTTMKRRDFLKTSTAAGLALAAAGTTRAADAEPGVTRYANVGTGSRSRMYQQAVLVDYKDHAQMVAYCDTNPGRLDMARAWAREKGGVDVPGYSGEDFDRMVAETKPDVVIVTTPDGLHHDFIIRAMQAGCDVITEKPMTIDAEKCQQIIDTQKATGRNCRVTFNYRYSPPRSQVKDLLMNGAIGEILSVDFHWMLNTIHGADYFRRWHSHKAVSGGLMVHKATHHFDLMNWWLSAVPERVDAVGNRVFYTPAMAKRFGLSGPHERCHTCPEKAKCGFVLDIAADNSLKRLYLDHESHDGYYRDRCVFRDDIDIEDTMSVIVTYDNGVSMSYSLNAFNAWEGYTVIFNGTLGRIEHQMVEAIYVSGTDAVQGGIKDGGVTTRIFPLRGEPRDVEPWSGEGGHGGGDKVMLDDIFLPNPAEDPYRRAADQRSGAYSILTGIAANHCFVSGGPVQISDLVNGVGYPAYPAMPSRDGSLPMPETV